MTSSKPNWKESNSKPNLLGSFLEFDARLSQRLTLPPESEQWHQARRMAHLGDGPFVLGGLGLVYTWSWWAEAVQLRQTTLLITLLVLGVALLVTLIKFGVRRRRPQPPGEFVTFRHDAYSFPSGHAARLAALAVGLMFVDPLFGWAGAILALSVALARVIVGVHYLGDIVIGLGLGALVAWGSFFFLFKFLPLG